MTYFQDVNGGLHYLSEQDITNGGKALLPKGCSEIDDAIAMNIQSQESPEMLALNARRKRDALLGITDVAINTLLDAGADVTSLRTYRGGLRNVPQQSGFPTSIVWPTFPADVTLSKADQELLNAISGN